MEKGKRNRLEYGVRKNPLFSACGLNCGLCPRHYTAGSSKCPGCAGEGFSKVHPPCGVLSCCGKRGFESCCECGEFPCGKLDGADQRDSFITHRNQLRDLARAKAMGLDAYGEELERKVALLERLLAGFDDGRRKSFFCVAANLLETRELEAAVGRIERETAELRDGKEKARAAARILEGMAEERGISLKLRK